MRSVLASLAVAVMLLAGCGTRDDGDGGPTPPPQGDPVRFAPPVRVGDNGEPGLRVANGTVWVHAPGHLWKSVDGTSFEELDLGVALGVFGNDADLAIGRDGTLYYTDLQLLTSLAVYRSRDGGAQWDYHPVASMLTLVDRQWIEAGPDAANSGQEAIYLAYNQIASSQWVAKSTDGGDTWVALPATPSQSQATFWTGGNLVVDPVDGTLWLARTIGLATHPVGSDAGATDWKVLLATSKDGGLTWAESTIADPEGNPGNLFPVLALDGNGTLYATWAQELADHTEIHLSRSTDDGATWSAPMRVNQHAGSAVQPWIEARGAGHLALVWYGANQTALPDVADTDWFLHYAYTLDGMAAQPSFTELKAWDEPVRRGAICTRGIACDPQTDDRELLDFFQVRLDGQGMAHIAFADTDHQSDGQGDTYYTRQVAGPGL